MKNPLDPSYRLSILDIVSFITISGFVGAFIGVQWASWYLCNCN
jgi:hypothetical protein